MSNSPQKLKKRQAKPQWPTNLAAQEYAASDLRLTHGKSGLIDMPQGLLERPAA